MIFFILSLVLCLALLLPVKASSKLSPLTTREANESARDEVLRQGIRLYSEVWLTEKMED